MTIQYAEQKRSLASFLTHVCAIIGGVIAAAGILDRWLYNAELKLKEKNQLGKSM